ncbi:putative RNA-directed DNA polymerase from transposon X-element [Trichonephila clavipes]|nr:putative RNA-directed DNA polymerase from transposon X-element [Trichonephila clavipes]
MIGHLGLSGKQRFLDIVNCFWNKGQLPRDWRRATVIPIKKCDRTYGTPGRCQPIALTSIACKIMEKIVLRRLTFHLHFPNLLLEEQYGFREGTADQLLYFRQRIRDAHNRKPTIHTVAVFLDLSKAFLNIVWNNFLVIKLYKMFGIGGKALPWIYDFLRNRLISVKFNNSLSRSFSFFQGVLQGSVLSPTLFSHYLSGIESVIKRTCEVGAFADDVVPWKPDSDLTKLERDINFVLEDIWNFALDHKLTFNPTKSLASKWLNILRYISGRDWGADAGNLRNTYISLIRPILEYGIPVYCSASVTNLQKLEKVQLSAARTITGLKNTFPRDIVLFDADLQPLSLRRCACLTKYYNKLRSLAS